MSFVGLSPTKVSQSTFADLFFHFFPFPLRVLVPDVCLGLLYVFTLAKIIPFAEYRAEIVASPVAGKMVGQAGGRPGGQAGR